MLIPVCFPGRVHSAGTVVRRRGTVSARRGRAPVAVLRAAARAGTLRGSLPRSHRALRIRYGELHS